MSIAVVFYEGLLRLATSSLTLLLIASVVLLLIRQPARRIRVIQWALAGLVVLPCLILLPGYPRLAILPTLAWSDSKVDGQRESKSEPVDEPLATPVALHAPQDVPPHASVTQRVLREDRTIETTEMPVFLAPRSDVPLSDPDPHLEYADVVIGALPTGTLPIATVPIGNPANDGAADEVVDKAVDERDLPGTTASPAPNIPWHLPSDYRVWIVAAYATGSIVMVLWSLVGLAAVRRLVRSARTAPAECRIILRAVGGPRSDRVALLVSSRAAQPCAVLWRPTTIILPEKLVADADPRALRWALAHEWSHVERGDLATWTAAGIVRWFTFYQPLVWWLRRQLQLCQDYVADAAAARAGGLPEDYAEFLTTSSFTRPTLAAGLGIGGRISDLRRRVVMLVEQRRPLETKSPRRWNLAALPIAVVLVAFAGGLAPKESEPKQGTAEAGGETSKVEGRTGEIAGPTTVGPVNSSDLTAISDKPKVSDSSVTGPAKKKPRGAGNTFVRIPDSLVEAELRKDPIVVTLTKRTAELRADLAREMIVRVNPAASEVVRELNALIDQIEQQIDEHKANLRPHVIEQLAAQQLAGQQRPKDDPAVAEKDSGAKVAGKKKRDDQPKKPTGPRKIAPGDVLTIEVMDNFDVLNYDDLQLQLLLPPTSTVTVGDDGEVSLGSAYGTAKLVGKTLPRAEQEIADRLENTTEIRALNNLSDSDLDDAREKYVRRTMRRMQINVRVRFANKGSSGGGFGGGAGRTRTRWTVQTSPAVVVPTNRAKAAALPKSVEVPNTFGAPRPAAKYAQPPVGRYPPTPRTPQRELIHPGDVLHLEAEPPEAKLDREATVEADGNLALGVRFGRVQVVGKTLTEAEKAIRAIVGAIYRDPSVQVTFVQQAPFDKQTTELHSAAKAARDNAKLEKLAAEMGRQRASHDAQVTALERIVKALKQEVLLLRGNKRRPKFYPPPPADPTEEPTGPESPLKDGPPSAPQPSFEPPGEPKSPLDPDSSEAVDALPK